MYHLGCTFPDPFYCFSYVTGNILEDGTFELEFCDEVLDIKADSDILKSNKFRRFH